MILMLHCVNNSGVRRHDLVTSLLAEYGFLYFVSQKSFFLSKIFGNVSLLVIEIHMWQFLVTSDYLKKFYGKT